MAKPSTLDLRALWATTKELIKKDLADGITSNIPILTEIKEKGNFKEVVGGGRDFNEPAIVGDSKAVGGFKKGDLLDMSEQEGIDAFEYAPAFFYGSVFMHHTELAMNAGEAQAVSLLEGRIEQTKLSIANVLDSYLVGSNQLLGVSSASNTGSQSGWLGLRDLIPDTATQDIPGTGVDKTKYSKARSAVTTTACATAAAWNTANAGRTIVQSVFNSAAFGLTHPTFCLMTRNIWDAFQLSLQANERFTDQVGGKDVKVGYPHVMYMADCRVTWGDNVLAGHFYMLNPKYLYLKLLKAMNFKMGDFIEAYNAPQEAAKIELGGQFCTNAPRYHSVYTGGGF
jgi:hypothetical protein